MKKFIFFVAVMTACSHIIQAQRTTTEVDIQSATAVTIEELNSGIRAFPFIFDYEMIPKDNPKPVYEEYQTGVSARSIANNPDVWINQFILLAKTEMMKKYGADAIFSATSAAKTDNRGNIVVVVRGYPVKYVNFRKATKEDLWILEFEWMNRRAVRPVEETNTRIDVIRQ